jgi:hypothetical protein
MMSYDVQKSPLSLLSAMATVVQAIEDEVCLILFARDEVVLK